MKTINLLVLLFVLLSYQFSTILGGGRYRGDHSSSSDDCDDGQTPVTTGDSIDTDQSGGDVDVITTETPIDPANTIIATVPDPENTIIVTVPDPENTLILTVPETTEETIDVTVPDIIIPTVDFGINETTTNIPIGKVARSIWIIIVQETEDFVNTIIKKGNASSWILIILIAGVILFCCCGCCMYLCCFPLCNCNKNHDEDDNDDAETVRESSMLCVERV